MYISEQTFSSDTARRDLLLRVIKCQIVFNTWNSNMIENLFRSQIYWTQSREVMFVMVSGRHGCPLHPRGASVNI